MMFRILMLVMVSLSLAEITNQHVYAEPSVKSQPRAYSDSPTRWVKVVKDSALLQLAEIQITDADGNSLTESATAVSSSDYNSLHTAEKAIDGDTNGNYAANKLFHSASADATPSLTVSLFNDQPIDAIKLWNRTDCCESRMQGITVYVADYDITQTDAATLDADDTVAKTKPDIVTNNVSQELKGNDFLNIGSMIAPSPTRWVKVVKDSALLQLAEIQITDADGNSLTESATAVSSSDYNSLHTAEKAIDGDTNGNYAANKLFHSASADATPSLTVSLFNDQPIDAIKLWNRTDCCESRMQGITVYVADYDITQTDAATLDADDTVAKTKPDIVTNNVSQELKGNDFLNIGSMIAPSPTRWVKVVKDSALLQLAEIQITDADGNSLTESATAVSSSDYNSLHTAEKAIDGDTNGNYAANKLFHSASADATPSLTVALFNEQPIGAIKLWNRTDCCESRMQGITVYVADYDITQTDAATLDADDTVAKTKPDIVTNNVSQELKGNDFLNVGTMIAPSPTRWVKVVKDSALLQLAEIQITDADGNSLTEGATASSSSAINSTHAADKAIDGDTNGNYTANKLFHSASADATPSLTVALFNEQPIGAIKLWNRTDCCESRMQGITVYVADYDITQTDAATLDADDTVAKTKPDIVTNNVSQELKGNDFLNIGSMIAPSPTRWVKVVKDSALLQLAEIQITDADGNSLTEGATASSSSAINSTHAADKAIDGDTNGNYTANKLFHSASADATPSLTVALFNEQPIGAIKLWNRTDCCESRMQGITVYVADYDITQTDAATLDADDTVAKTKPDIVTNNVSQELKGNDFLNVGTMIAPSPTRWVKVVKDSALLQLAEIQITDADGNSLTEGATASSSSAINSTHAADKAIDGDTNGNYTANKLFHSASADATPSLTVALFNEQPIGAIKLWNRTDCCESRMQGITVYVADYDITQTDAATLDADDTVAKTKPDIVTNNVSQELKGNDFLNIGSMIAPSPTRWVKVVKDSALLQLAEIQITDADGNSLTESATAVSSSDYNSLHTAEKAIDGDTNGNYAANKLFHSASADATPSLTVSLFNDQPIDAIKLWNRTDCCESRMQGITVYVADYDITQTDAATLDADDTVAKTKPDIVTNNVSQELKGNDFLNIGSMIAPSPTRWVKVVKDSALLQLAEIQITDADGNSLTESATAVSSSDYNSLHTAEKAIDGDTNGNYAANKLFHSASADATPSLTVSLFNDQPIDAIKLWNRTDCCESRMQGITVYVADYDITQTDAATLDADDTVAKTKPDIVTNNVSQELKGNDFLNIGSMIVYQKPTELAIISMPTLNTKEDTVGMATINAEGEGALLYAIKTPPAHGAASISSTGVITYTPVSNFNGNDRLTLSLSDDSGAIIDAIVNVAVDAVNDAPLANAGDDVSIVVEQSVRLTGSASDIDGVISTYHWKDESGQLLGSSAILTFSPETLGSHTLTYTVTDNLGMTTTDTVVVTVSAPPAPIISPLPTVLLDEDSAASISAHVTGVGALNYRLKQPPKHGTASITQSGEISYTPSANYHGSDSLIIEVSDGYGGASEQRVTVVVNSVNDLPTIDLGDVINVSVDETITLHANGVDIDGEIISYRWRDQQGNSIGTSSTLVYTPKAVGEQEITLEVIDNENKKASSALLVRVSKPLKPYFYDIEQHLVLDNEPSKILELHAQGTGNLSYSVAVEPSHGHVQINKDTQQLTYSSDSNFTGSDTFTVKVTDEYGGEDLAIINVDVSAEQTIDQSAGKIVISYDSVDQSNYVDQAELKPANEYIIAPKNSVLIFKIDYDGIPLDTIEKLEWSNTADIYGFSGAHDTASATGGAVTYTVNGEPIYATDHTPTLSAYVTTSVFDFTVKVTDTAGKQYQKTIKVNQNPLSLPNLDVVHNCNGYPSLNRIYAAEDKGPAYACLHDSGQYEHYIYRVKTQPHYGQAEIVHDYTKPYSDQLRLALKYTGTVPNNDKNDALVLEVLENNQVVGLASITVVLSNPDRDDPVIQDEYELVSYDWETREPATVSQLTMTEGQTLQFKAKVYTPDSGTVEASTMKCFLYYRSNCDSAPSWGGNSCSGRLKVDGKYYYADTMNDHGSTCRVVDKTPNADDPSMVEFLVDFRPNPDDSGEVYVYVQVDPDPSDTQSNYVGEKVIPVTISDINDPPYTNYAIEPLFLRASTSGGSVSARDRIIGLRDPEDAANDLTGTLVSPPVHGSVTLSSTSSYTYTSDPEFIGTDEFTVRVTDPHGASTDFTVPVIVLASAENGAPIIDPEQKVYLLSNRSGTIEIPFYDEEDSVLYFDIISHSSGIEASLLDDFDDELKVSVNYVDARGYTDETITLKATDREGLSTEKTIKVSRFKRRQLYPYFTYERPQSFYEELQEDTAKTIAVPAADVDGDALVYSISKAPEHGHVTIEPDTDNSIYTPNKNYVGTDEYEVTVDDGHANTASRTVYVRVIPVNDAPEFTHSLPDALAMHIKESISLDFTATDVDSDAITYQASALNGEATISDEGLLDYTAPTVAGDDTLTVTVTDGQGAETSKSIDVIAVSTNKNPTITSNAELLLQSNNTYSHQLIAADPDSDSITYSIVTAPTLGVATVNELGLLVYTHNTDRTGYDSLVIQASDNNGGTSFQNILVRVTPAVQGEGDTALAVDAGLDRTVRLGAVVSLAGTTNHANGSEAKLNHRWSIDGRVLSLAATADYTPSGLGLIKINYTATDGTGNSSTDHFTLTVIEPSGLPVEPSTDSNTASLAGIDTNLDGVRDDVERHIAIIYPYAAQASIRQAQLYLARTLQRYASMEDTSKVKISELKELVSEYSCQLKLSNTDDGRNRMKVLATDIITIQANTIERSYQLAKIMDRLDPDSDFIWSQYVRDCHE